MEEEHHLKLPEDKRCEFRMEGLYGLVEGTETEPIHVPPEVWRQGPRAAELEVES